MPHLTINTRICIAATCHTGKESTTRRIRRPSWPIRTISISRHLSEQAPQNEPGHSEIHIHRAHICVLVHSEHWAGKNCWPISWRKLMLLRQAQCQKEGKKNGTEKMECHKPIWLEGESRGMPGLSSLSAVPFSCCSHRWIKRGGLDRSQARPHSKAPIYPPGRNRNPRNIERAHRICNAVGMPYNRYQLYCSARHCLALRASDRTSPRLIQDLPCHRHPHGHGIAPPAIHRALHTKSGPVLRHEKLGGMKNDRGSPLANAAAYQIHSIQHSRVTPFSKSS